jgi:N-acetyl-gamma-glutamyl-phosphate reductase
MRIKAAGEHTEGGIGMTFRVAVAGASGYAGGELLRLLLAHPRVDIGAITGNASAGDLLGAHQPHLAPLAERTIEPTTVATLRGHDAIFLALPHGHSAALAADIAASGDDPVILDCGADHRLADAADWQRFYGGTHAGSWPYGLPELPGARERLRGARRVAVPGCYPTVVSLAMAPALAAGVAAPEVVAVAASGTSGAGRDPKPHLLGSEVMGAVSAYGVGGTHRHTPEMTQNLSAVAGAPVTVSFTPLLAPMPRGILATVSAPATPGVGIDDIRAVYEKAYRDEPFVRLLPSGLWPSTAMTLAANTVVLQVAHDASAGRVVVVGAIDNLTKGTAGGAIQCFNLALGLDETLGLPMTGVSP